MANMRDLLDRRKQLRSQIEHLTLLLEGVERQIFARVERAAVLLDGEQPPSPSDQPWKAPTPARMVAALGVRPDDSLSNPYLFSSSLPSVAGSVFSDSTMDLFKDRSAPPGLSVSFGVTTQPSTVGFSAPVTGMTPLSRPAKRIVDAARDILRESVRPVRTAEILRRLHERGIYVPGKNPTNNLSAHLSNHGEFESTREGWVLRSARWESAGGSAQSA